MGTKLSPLGQYIKEQVSIKRKKEGRPWSQNELARRAGISGGALSMIINGKVQPKAPTLIQIANALNIDSEPLLKVAGLLKLAGVIDQSEDKIHPTLLDSVKIINSLSGNDRQTAIELVKEVANAFKKRNEQSSEIVIKGM